MKQRRGAGDLVWVVRHEVSTEIRGGCERILSGTVRNVHHLNRPDANVKVICKLPVGGVMACELEQIDIPATEVFYRILGAQEPRLEIQRPTTRALGAFSS